MRTLRLVALFLDTPEARAPMLAELRHGLAAFGWAEGEDYVLDARFAYGSEDRLRALATEAVVARPDVLLAAGTVPAVAARSATTEIPIVMVGVGDPVALGLIASFDRPGGNVTGSSDQSPDAPGERLAFFRAVLPHSARIGVVGALRLLAPAQYEVAAARVGLSLRFLDVRFPGTGVEATVRAAALDDLDGLFVVPNPASYAARAGLASLCLERHLALMVGWREFMDVPAALGCGPNLTRLYGRLGPTLARLRAGESPASIPAERPLFERWVRPGVLAAIGARPAADLPTIADEVLAP